jgi:hypothetical protein
MEFRRSDESEDKIEESRYVRKLAYYINAFIGLRSRRRRTDTSSSLSVKPTNEAK